MAVSSTGEIGVTSQEFYLTQYLNSGFVEQDPQIIFAAVGKVIREVLAQAIGNDLLGICFSAAMHSMMAVDEHGKAITPLLIWADTRSTSQSKQIISSGLAQELYEVTGTPVHPMSPLCKLLWWRDHQPEIINQAAKFLSIKEYVIFRLTGEYLIDYSTASATGLFDLQLLKWSGKAINLHQIPIEKFSTPVSTYHQINSNQVGSHYLGFAGPLTIIVGASDGCSAQLGCDAMNSGDLSITLGTSGAVRTASNQRIIDPMGRIFNYILDESTFVCGGATNSGTSLLTWFSDKFDPSSSKNLVEFINEIDLIAPGADGLIALPFLFGERAPMYDPYARGVFFGVSVNHTQKHFQRAMVEGICFELKSIVQLIEQSMGTSKRIMVSGGITYSHGWVQLLSNVLGKELIVSNSTDASALGAAIIGFRAMGIESTQSKKDQFIFYPDLLLHKWYEAHYEIFEMLYKQTAPLFERMTQLRK